MVRATAASLLTMMRWSAGSPVSQRPASWCGRMMRISGRSGSSNCSVMLKRCSPSPHRGARQRPAWVHFPGMSHKYPGAPMYNATTHLSATEAAVLRGLAAGQRTAQIARATALNEATVFDLLDTRSEEHTSELQSHSFI